MKKLSILLLVFVAAFASCKKTPEVNLKYVDIERELITVGTTVATVQCDYEYIATLKKAFFYYGETEDDMNTAEMRVVQATLYADLSELKENTTYSYYYEFVNGFNSMRSATKTFKTDATPVTPPAIMLPTVVTASVMEITASSAKSGGEVTSDGGAEVTERGICWSTNANPTLSDSHIAVDTGTGTFTAIMNGLEANTTYHVRAYATNEKGTAFGLDREFTTLEGGGGSGDEHEWVDFGLPSGTLWATCNVGANSPEEYGDYFAWGETEPKSIYNWSTYKYCHGDRNSMTKYCNMSDYGYNGFTDELTLLEANDDAATANWGGAWCMPTADQWRELYDFTTTLWTIQNEVPGLLFIANNGNSMFLPAAGHYSDDELYLAGIDGVYGSNQLYTDDPSDNRCVQISESNIYYGYEMTLRMDGLSVRPVRKTNTPPPPGNVPEGAINGLFSVSPTQKVYFSQGNLQYQASTNIWRFAENQWDFVGSDNHGTVYVNGVKCDNLQISSSYGGWIDLFGWGTSGYNHGAVCYQPWSYSIENEDYYAYGQISNYLYQQTGQADWGYNSISNGGNVENIWRTLTESEWGYIFRNRQTLSGIHYAKAEINETIGVLILPDNWDVSNYDLFEADNYWWDTIAPNMISITDWNEILEPLGVVFLPAAGSRYGTQNWSIGVGNCSGYYWSSTCRDSDYFPSVVHFYQIIDPVFHEYRSNGLSVRLVQDANPQNKAK